MSFYNDNELIITNEETGECIEINLDLNYLNGADID